jgi:hypothetical protein
MTEDNAEQWETMRNIPEYWEIVKSWKVHAQKSVQAGVVLAGLLAMMFVWVSGLDISWWFQSFVILLFVVAWSIATVMWMGKIDKKYLPPAIFEDMGRIP